MIQKLKIRFARWLLGQPCDDSPCDNIHMVDRTQRSKDAVAKEKARQERLS
jgi:hypothetical protein